MAIYCMIFLACVLLGVVLYGYFVHLPGAIGEEPSEIVGLKSGALLSESDKAGLVMKSVEEFEFSIDVRNGKWCVRLKIDPEDSFILMVEKKFYNNKGRLVYQGFDGASNKDIFDRKPTWKEKV